MAMTKKERFMNALLGKEVDRIPVFCANQTATYEQMKALNAFWPEAHYKAEPMAILAEGANSILGFDAVRVPFCQTIESEALGCVIKDGGEKGVPSIDVHPYKLNDKIEFPENFREKGRIPEVAQALKTIKSKVGDEVAVLGGIVGPFSIATNLLGLTDILMGAMMEPEKVKPWLEISERAAIEFAKALIDAGADVIVIEDMMSSMDLISPQMYKDLAGPSMKRVIDEISVPTILHICGKVNPLIEDMIATGATAFSVDIVVDVKDIKEKIAKSGRHVAVVGGVDAVNTLFYGKEVEPVQAQVKEAIELGYDLIAPSCSIPPATPDFKLKAMVEAASAVKLPVAN